MYLNSYSDKEPRVQDLISVLVAAAIMKDSTLKSKNLPPK
jgi:hypothetical protein